MKHPPRILATQGDDGRQYTLYIYTEAAPSAMRTALVGGLELATSDGHLVRWRAKGVYEIVTTGVVLHSAELDAP
jgi:hypothetical protein